MTEWTKKKIVQKSKLHCYLLFVLKTLFVISPMQNRNSKNTCHQNAKDLTLLFDRDVTMAWEE